MSDGELVRLDKTSREGKRKEFLAHRFWRRYMTHFHGLSAEVKTGCRELGAGPEAHALLGSVDGVIWGSGAKARLVNLKQKAGFLVRVG